MSMPVRYCALVRAAEDPEAFTKLHPAMYRNLKGGHFSVYPCNHETPCRELTEQESADLLKRFAERPSP